MWLDCFHKLFDSVKMPNLMQYIWGRARDCIESKVQSVLVLLVYRANCKQKNQRMPKAVTLHTLSRVAPVSQENYLSSSFWLVSLPSSISMYQTRKSLIYFIQSLNVITSDLACLLHCAPETTIVSEPADTLSWILFSCSFSHLLLCLRTEVPI